LNFDFPSGGGRPLPSVWFDMLINQITYLSFISFQSRESVFGKKREHFHKRNALLRTPHPLREHYRKLLMPTPVRSELRSLRHSRNSDVVFQEDAKNFGLFIQKRSNSERKGTKKKRQTISTFLGFYDLFAYFSA
jgi:hypothetical protein